MDRVEGLSGADGSIRPLAPAEVSEASGLLARAFRDNPLNVAVIGSDDAERRLRCNTFGMRSLLPVARAGGQVLVARLGLEADGALVAGLVAAPPYAYPLPPPPLWARLRSLLGQGWQVAHRWAGVFQALDALHPDEPHWYLCTLGVEPTLQGRGIGTALLRHWVAQADTDAVAAYLETDVFGNVAFYERAGFQVVGETRLLGARVWRMRRAPRAD